MIEDYKNLNINLKNTKVLVTGASNGIGYELANFLMKMGAQVAIHYNSNKEKATELLEKYPETNSIICKANLENEKEVISLFATVTKEFNNIDSVVLNAGVFIPHSTKLELEEWYSTWQKTLSINLNAVGLLTKLSIDHFRKNNQGRLIYIGSRATFRGETEEYLAYAASKGGLTSLARSVARSFGKENIKSFIIAPGFTRTAMAESFIDVYGEKRVLDEIGLNELTKPKDISPIVGLMVGGFLDHATGATIDINAASHIR